MSSSKIHQYYRMFPNENYLYELKDTKIKRICISITKAGSLKKIQNPNEYKDNSNKHKHREEEMPQSIQDL